MAISKEVRTHLSLDRFAKICSLDPLHFAGATGTTFWRTGGTCERRWPQWGWQDANNVGREEIAHAIYEAERQLQRVLGFPVAPEYVENECRSLDKYYYSNYPTSARYALQKDISTEMKKIISAGVRSITLIEGDVPVTYSDGDGDGWDEIAAVSVTTSVTDKKKIRLFFEGQGGDEKYEIRPLNRIDISGGVATITANSHLFIDPDLWFRFNQNTTEIDAEDSASFVPTVDVYMETVDTTTPATFIWHPLFVGGNGFYCGCGGSGCSTCTTTEQDACALVDTHQDTLQVYPVNGSFLGSYSLSREPDQVRYNYVAGYQSSEYIRGKSLDPLDDVLARAIVYLSVAGLDSSPCSCGNMQSFFNTLRQDTARSDPGSKTLFFMPFELTGNPFGSRVGQIRAWQLIAKVQGEGFSGGVL